MIELKIDPSTLPTDGQKVKWQTHADQDNGDWKEGIYLDDEGYGLFLYNIEPDGTTRHWDLMWDVLHGKLFQNKFSNC